MRYKILKMFNPPKKKSNLISEWMQRFFILFLNIIMTCFYLQVQMKSLKDFKCGWIINNVDINKCKNSQFFDEITIKASPPIYIYGYLYFYWLFHMSMYTMINLMDKIDYLLMFDQQDGINLSACLGYKERYFKSNINYTQWFLPVFCLFYVCPPLDSEAEAGQRLISLRSAVRLRFRKSIWGIIFKP